MGNGETKETQQLGEYSQPFKGTILRHHIQHSAFRVQWMSGYIIP